MDKFEECSEYEISVKYTHEFIGFMININFKEKYLELFPETKLKGPKTVLIFSIYNKEQNYYRHHYKASLDIFNNPGRQSKSNPVSESEQYFWKGYGHYILCKLLNYVKNNGLLNSSDRILVQAQAKYDFDQQKLVSYYKSIGFTPLTLPFLIATLNDLLYFC